MLASSTSSVYNDIPTYDDSNNRSGRNYDAENKQVAAEKFASTQMLLPHPSSITQIFLLIGKRFTETFRRRRELIKVFSWPLMIFGLLVVLYLGGLDKIFIAYFDGSIEVSFLFSISIHFFLIIKSTFSKLTHAAFSGPDIIMVVRSSHCSIYGL